MVKTKGFTLIELIVAVSIFSIISTAAYFFISNVLNANERSEDVAAQLVDLQKGMRLMQQDFEQLVNRPIRDAYGSTQPAFSLQADTGVTFTRLGWPVLPMVQSPRSEVLRVQYELDGERLMRRYWPIPDQADDPKVREMVVFDEVKQFSLRLLYEGTQPGPQWAQTWPDALSDAVLPQAIEVLIELPRYGEIKRLFRGSHSNAIRAVTDDESV